MHAARSLLRIVCSLATLTFAFVAHANDEYQGKVAVITGSSHGLGMELAIIAADKKMKLVLADIRPEPSKAFGDTVKKNGGEAIVVEVDLAIAEQRPRVIDAAMKQFGRID